MDDPIFDSWTRDTEPPPSAVPRAPRWRSPETAGPTVPVAPSSAAPRAARAPTSPPRARLSGTPGFLRTMAVPRLEDIAQRLVMARHEAVVEDLLDEAPPIVRLTMRPWRGQLAAPSAVAEGSLELAIEEGTEEISLHVWLGPRTGPSSDQERVPTAKLGAAWLEGRVLSFVQRLLDLA